MIVRKVVPGSLAKSPVVALDLEEREGDITYEENVVN